MQSDCMQRDSISMREESGPMMCSVYRGMLERKRGPSGPGSKKLVRGAAPYKAPEFG